MKILAESQVLNYTEALGRLMDDKEILLAVYEEYARTIHITLKELEKGIIQGDNELVIRSAHSLKGASLSIGAEVVGYYSYELEKASKAKETTVYLELKDKITPALAEALVAVNAYLE